MRNAMAWQMEVTSSNGGEHGLWYWDTALGDKQIYLHSNSIFPLHLLLHEISLFHPALSHRSIPALSSLPQSIVFYHSELKMIWSLPLHKDHWAFFRDLSSSHICLVFTRLATPKWSYRVFLRDSEVKVTGRHTSLSYLAPCTRRLLWNAKTVSHSLTYCNVIFSII